MTVTGTRRDFLSFIWHGFSQLFRSVHLRVIARRQARLLSQPPAAQPPQPIITVAAQPIAPITLTPVEQELIQVSEQVSHEMTGQVKLSYETQDRQNTQDRQDSKTGQPDLTRGQLIEALLDEAYAQGITTYPKLIAYITEQTGTGCSRRAIAAWKKSRGLT
jgi:hypothetical protein